VTAKEGNVEEKITLALYWKITAHVLNLSPEISNRFVIE
jgi:hypothetical protein